MTGIALYDHRVGDWTSLKGLVPESWCCVDCNVNTAPGLLNRAAAEDYAKALRQAVDGRRGRHPAVHQ
jgi:hypothetical protein